MILISFECPVNSVRFAPLKGMLASNRGAELVYTEMRRYTIAGDRHVRVEQLCGEALKTR